MKHYNIEDLQAAWNNGSYNKHFESRYVDFCMSHKRSGGEYSEMDFKAAWMDGNKQGNTCKSWLWYAAETLGVGRERFKNLL